MNASLCGPFRQLLDARRGGRELLLLFDYDGTLAPFSPLPSQALMPPRARRAIESLARLPGVHVGIISGRQLSDLKAIVGIDGLFLGGTNGLELDFRGLLVRHPRAAASLSALGRLHDSFAESVPRFPGAWLERKQLGFTLHYRQVDRRRHVTLRALVSQFIETCAQPFVVHEGAAAFEIVPRLGWNKGTAAGMFLNSIAGERPVILYAGDNSNDHDAMQVVLCNGGLTIGVGRQAPRSARHVLPGPEHLEEFLSHLALVFTACG
ncbi:MAG TPA: trehalose-phosphatase [Planctomycetaceae bacterium]